MFLKKSCASEIPIPKVMVVGGGALGSHEGGAVMNGIHALMKRTLCSLS